MDNIISLLPFVIAIAVSVGGFIFTQMSETKNDSPDE